MRRALSDALSGLLPSRGFLGDQVVRLRGSQTGGCSERTDLPSHPETYVYYLARNILRCNFIYLIELGKEVHLPLALCGHFQN